MVDNLTPEDRRKTMQAVKSRNTSLERKLFSMLAGMGIKGWKKGAPDIQGKPDVVFYSKRLVVFVDGCFWHGCPVCKGKKPETNSEYWRQKVLKNKARDEKYHLELKKQDWRVVRIWEHEMSDKASRKEVRLRIHQAMEGDDQNGRRQSDHNFDFKTNI
jgi:DNA mismatch endonuclease, patch repair protein